MRHSLIPLVNAKQDPLLFRGEQPLPVMDQEPEFKPSGMLCVFLGLLPTGAILSGSDDPDYPGGSIRFSTASYQPTRCGSW